VRNEQAGTYIADILLERDSALARWPDRKGVPLTVWIQPASNVHDFSPSFAARVRAAFEEWDALDLPVHFSFVDDSADAEVHVSWIDRFRDPISGRTRWARDDSWTITDANITLAVHHNQGELLEDDAMQAMALHEIGHLLGLDHTGDTTSIMAPRVRVRSLSAADRATARLLYALPAGPIK
jgi:predicted Zn-dependent protease